MATQVLEFTAASGLSPLSCKLFPLGTDTVIAVTTATEKSNDKNRYTVSFTDIPAGAYRLNGFVGAVGGFANEVYDLTLTTATFYPRSEPLASGSISTQLAEIAAKTALIGTGEAFVSSPVTPEGSINDLIIGDDYLASNSRSLDWVIDAVTGFSAGTASCRFGGGSQGQAWKVSGTITDLNNGKWQLSFNLPRNATSHLLPKSYPWSVEVVSASGTEVTRVRGGGVNFIKKYT